MVNRISNSWQFWLTLAFLWTFAAAASAWLDLPRATGIPHEAQFIERLSPEAAAILRGPSSAEKLAPGAPLWADTPRVYRMFNGMQLDLPATTTNEQAGIVKREYRDLLEARAAEQRWFYWLERTSVWLGFMLLTGYVVILVHRTARDAPITGPRPYSGPVFAAVSAL
jgi:hypothetical protein